MPIFLAIAGLVFLALLFGPQLWVKRVIAQHGAERPDLPGTGAELARHLLDEANLPSVVVEPTDKADHYDPETHGAPHAGALRRPLDRGRGGRGARGLACRAARARRASLCA